MLISDEKNTMVGRIQKAKVLAAGETRPMNVSECPSGKVTWCASTLWNTKVAPFSEKPISSFTPVSITLKKKVWSVGLSTINPKISCSATPQATGFQLMALRLVLRSQAKPIRIGMPSREMPRSRTVVSAGRKTARWNMPGIQTQSARRFHPQHKHDS